MIFLIIILLNLPTGPLSRKSSHNSVSETLSSNPPTYIVASGVVVCDNLCHDLKSILNIRRRKGANPIFLQPGNGHISHSPTYNDLFNVSDQNVNVLILSDR